MLIHEYQARELFQQYGIPVSPGKVFNCLDGVRKYVEELNHAVVVKAQVHAGGRGKAGGVKFAPTVDEAVKYADDILGMHMVNEQTGEKGIDVHKIMIVPAANIAKEYYLAITVDRATRSPFIIASTEGGVEIEQVAEENPDKILKIQIDPQIGVWPYHGRRIAQALDLHGDQARKVSGIVQSLYKMFMEKDCSIVEINPLILTKLGRVEAIDGKVNFDDNGLFSHPEIVEMRDEDEEDPLEVEASSHGLSYIKLEGNVACMVNGAGLAMATMDMIQISGGSPANFLDVGGTATPARVEAAFRILLKDPNVKGVLVNIFGGIVRCDLVAQGIVEAMKHIGSIEQPIVIRLSGTNAEEGRKILEDSDINFELAENLNEAAAKIVSAVQE